MPPKGGAIFFPYGKSDISALGRSDIIFAINCPQAISFTKQISLGSAEYNSPQGEYN